MILKEFYFSSACDQLIIAGLAVLPAAKPKGILQFIHGMAEHKERYLECMKFMSAEGYICIIHDHRGHGRSVKTSADLGYFYNVKADYLMKDIHQINTFIKHLYPNLPCFMLGHSMGSLLARAFLKHYPSSLDAIIICGSPSYQAMSRAGLSLSAILSKLKGAHYRSKLIQGLVFGKHQVSVGLLNKNAWICANEYVVQEYNQDPLCGFIFTLNGFQNLFALMLEVYHVKGWYALDPQLPIRFISGEHDPCIINKKKFIASASFMKIAGYNNVSARLFSNMRHEILNEKDKYQVYQDILLFINNNKALRSKAHYR